MSNKLKVKDKRRKKTDDAAGPAIAPIPLRKEKHIQPFSFKEKMRVLMGANMVFETVFRGNQVEFIRCYLEGQDE